MNTLDFISLYLGKRVDFDRVYGYQCTDLVELYNKLVLGKLPIGGNGGQMFESAPANGYIKVFNTPTNYPVMGDLVMWQGPFQSLGISAFGHTAIALLADVHTLITLDQNWPVSSAVHIQPHSYQAVQGWLRKR